MEKCEKNSRSRIDQFIATYGIDLKHAEEVVRMDSKRSLTKFFNSECTTFEIVSSID